MSVKRFEDLICWQKARQLSKDIYLFTQLSRFAADYGLVGQIRRSSGSVMDNIAEGYERDGAKELIQFLSIAKGSLGEVRSQLYRAHDQRYITDENFKAAYELATETSRIVSGFIAYVRSSGFKGTKYKMEEPPMNYGSPIESDD